jgi:hypothetical protein
MINHETQAADGRSARRWGTGAALVATGLAGCVIIAGAMGASANAATTTPSPAAISGTAGGATGGTGAPGTRPQHPVGDPSTPQRSDESLLTGDTAAQVTAAALATYPNATIARVETDSDGVYEAHVVTTAGDRIIVQVGQDFTVTGTQQPGTGGPGGGHGAPGNDAPRVDPDPNDNHGPGTSHPGGGRAGSPSTSGSAATPGSTA